MSSTDPEVEALVAEIAEALRREDAPDRCQTMICRLAAQAGWRQARRLVLSAVHRGARQAWRAA